MQSLRTLDTTGEKLKIPRLRREREEEVIQAKDGWAVADKIDQFFNEVLILVVLIGSTSF